MYIPIFVLVLAAALWFLVIRPMPERKGGTSKKYEVRRASDGKWEQRLAPESQVAALTYLKHYRQKMCAYGQLPQDERYKSESPGISSGTSAMTGRWLRSMPAWNALKRITGTR